MFDVTFLIPDYSEEDIYPPDPDEVMPDREKERLFEELCEMIDSGAFNATSEVV